MGKEWAREGLGVFVLWLPCTTSSSLVYSPVCATCRSIVNSHFLVCLLFVALCICCCLSRFWCYANLCKACAQCRFLLWRKCYKCRNCVYVCTPTSTSMANEKPPCDPITAVGGQQWLDVPRFPQPWTAAKKIFMFTLRIFYGPSRASTRSSINRHMYTDTYTYLSK